MMDVRIEAVSFTLYYEYLSQNFIVNLEKIHHFSFAFVVHRVTQRLGIEATQPTKKLIGGSLRCAHFLRSVDE